MRPHLTSEEWDFFLAHASDDTGAAEELYALLQPSKVFLDTRTLIPGDNWDQVLPRAQRASEITVILISSHTENAHYQREEIAAAINRTREEGTGHRVIPVFLEDLPAEAVPYGLRSRHSLYAAADGSLTNVATRLKEALQIHKKANSSHTHASSLQSLKYEQTLLDAIARLAEESLYVDVVAPLLSEVHPGRIDFVNARDKKRLLISSGVDKIRRPHTLCAHIEAIPSDVAAKDFETACRPLKQAKNEGLVRDNGQKLIVNEAWLITPHPLFEKARRSIAKALEKLSKQNIQFISGDELIHLLVDNVPDVATRLSKYSMPEIMRLISVLSKHTEGRAFGFAADKNITEFYVTAALSPHATRAYAAVRGKVSIHNVDLEDDIAIGKLITIPDLFLTTNELRERVRKRAIENVTNGILNRFNVDVRVSLGEKLDEIRRNFIAYSMLDPQDFLDYARFILKLKAAKDPLSLFLRNQLSPKTQQLLLSYDGSNAPEGPLLSKPLEEISGLLPYTPIYEKSRFAHRQLSRETRDLLKLQPRGNDLLLLNRLLLEEAYPKEISANQYASFTLPVILKFDFTGALRRLIRTTKASIRNCPPVLDDNATLVRNTWQQLELTENFIRIVEDHFRGVPDDINDDDNHVSVSAAVRVRIPHPQRLLELDKVLLVEGPPGCGKTTLLKMLAIDLISANRRVAYLPCFNIAADTKNRSLEELAERFSEGSPLQDGDLNNTILIVDGLDEAPFDVTASILEDYAKFGHLVVSTRIAFATRLRSEFFRIELAPFTNEERTLFFQKWFGADQQLISQAHELIARYSDIDTHTRLPLIATIMVVLLQNEIVPKTRAEIYGFRLDLLLSKWDRLRGVKRLAVDNPDAKRRFLRELAYQLHSSQPRKRKITYTELRDIYESSLGAWGYDVSFEDIMKDLVVGSGVLIEESRGVYSLGHLTFQEHLAGEYISMRYSVKQISLLLNDDWWREALNFYASIQGDITELLAQTMEDFSHMAYAKQLSIMASYAPYTSPGAVQSLRDFLSDSNAQDD